MQIDIFKGETKPPIVVAYGMGVDSTALLVGMVKKGIRPDLILFADTEAEKQETYDFEKHMQRFLNREGFPPIVTVKYQPVNFKNYPPYTGLETNCLTNGTLPGISFGPASCSQKWKQQPQHNFLKNWQPAVDAWKSGLKVVKLIGFDDSPTDRRRTYRAANSKDDRRYQYRMPLQEWHWDREECKRQIRSVGLPVPPKSSCFFCLAMKPHEVDALPKEKLRRIVRMEARAYPRLRKSEGLWRSFVKGKRGGVPRPGSMTQYIRERGLLPKREIDYIWEQTPREIVAFQTAYANAKLRGSLDAFLAEVSDYREDVVIPYADCQCIAV